MVQIDGRALQQIVPALIDSGPELGTVTDPQGQKRASRTSVTNGMVRKSSGVD